MALAGSGPCPGRCQRKASPSPRAESRWTIEWSEKISDYNNYGTFDIIHSNYYFFYNNYGTIVVMIRSINMNNNYGTCITYMFQHVPTCSNMFKTMKHDLKTHGLFGSEHLQFRSSIAALDAGKSFAAASCGGIDGLPGRCRELSTSGGERCERCAFKSEESGEKHHFRGDIHTLYYNLWHTYLHVYFWNVYSIFQ